jgi:tripartite-type tricarboxylate transporter receptor subunit TctC
LHLAAGAAALPAVSRIAQAQPYPSRPVHWIVSFAAGGPNDIVARTVGQYLSDHLGQQFVIENRAGAAGNVGVQSALTSAPDGYTIAFVGPNYAINPGLYEKLPFDFFIRDSVPVHIKTGKVHALGVTALKRLAALPDVPTIGETVPGYEVSIWYGIAAPRGTPPAIVEKLNQAVNAVLADPKLQTRLAELAGEPMPMTPAEFGKLVAEETEKWGKVIRAANIKPE